MKKITEKQVKFLRSLLEQARRAKKPIDFVDVDLLSRKEAGDLISKLVEQRTTQAWSSKPKQAFLSLPDPEPMPLPPDLPPELAEFKRWARGVYQRGEQTISQLCALHDERFGPLKINANEPRRHPL